MNNSKDYWERKKKRKEAQKDLRIKCKVILMMHEVTRKDVADTLGINRKVINNMLQDSGLELISERVKKHILGIPKGSKVNVKRFLGWKD
jgi:transposase-like protein